MLQSAWLACKQLYAQLIASYAIAEQSAAQDDAQRFLQLGREQADLDNWKQALNHVNKASDLQPRDSDILYHRGRIYKGLGDYNAALVDLDTALRLQCSHAESLMLRGEV